MRAHRLLVALVCAALAACTSSDVRGAAPASPEQAPAGPSTYLALGDSVAAGAGAAEGRGYVALLADLLSRDLGCDAGALPGCPLRLENLAQGGATTATLRRSQLPSALKVLRTEDVRLVTVTIGGNDLFEPVVRACAQAPSSTTCADVVAGALQRAEDGVDEVLRQLADSAGPETTLALMTYYDPLPACRLAPLQPLAELVLEGDGTRPGLNDVLRERAAEHGVTVVETGPALSAPEDFVGGGDCLHPSAQGHARIAAAFHDEVRGDVATPG